MNNQFHHIQAAHCENGVTTNLLSEVGVTKLTEPLAFGIGTGLFFIHIPLLKVNKGPAIAFRTMPGLIFKRTCHSLGVPVVRKKFSSKEKARAYLDDCLNKGIHVGCQVGVYYLPYFPKEYRFHFNAHNIIVYGKEGNRYLVSDPVMETVTSLTDYELERVRFAKGALAPRGQLYYPQKPHNITDNIIRKAIKTGVKRNINHMLYIPGNIAGVKGIATMGRKIKKWRDQFGPEKSGLYLAQLVRMQEEIGTGGGGFRYIYGAFLQQATAYYPDESLVDISKMFTESGDRWRDAAVQAAGIYKGRIGSQSDYNDLGNRLIEISNIEKEAFKRLKKVNWQ